MAGIGMTLGNLARRNSVAAQGAFAIHSVLLVAGPTVLIMLSVGLITLGLYERQVVAEVTAFRVALLYVFLGATLSAVPVSYYFVRLFADDLSVNAVNALTRHVYHGLCAAGAVCLSFCVTAFLFGMVDDGGVALVLGFVTLVLTLAFTALAFITITRSYRSISFVFLAGTITSTANVIITSSFTYELVWLLLAYGAGLCVVVAGLLYLLFAALPTSEGGKRAARALSGQRRKSDAAGRWLLVAGGLCSVLGLWVDNFVYWTSPVASTSLAGLSSAPAYDQATFLALLAILPALSIFMVICETEYFGGYRRLYTAILSGATLRSIAHLGDELYQALIRRVFAIYFAQLVLTVFFAFLSPVYIEAIGVRYGDNDMLRYMLIAGSFYLLMVMASWSCIFMNRPDYFAFIGAVFLGLNATLAVAGAHFGLLPSGLGFMIACGVAATAALHLQGRAQTNFLQRLFTA